jgi:hypothetical protein
MGDTNQVSGRYTHPYVTPRYKNKKKVLEPAQQIKLSFFPGRSEAFSPSILPHHG